MHDNKYLKLEGDRRDFLLKGLTKEKEELIMQIDRWINIVKTEDSIAPNVNRNLFVIIERLKDTAHWLDLLC